MLDWKKKSGKSQTSDASTRRKTREKKRGRSLFAIDHNRRRRDWYTKSIQRARVNSCVSIETRPGRHCSVVPWELIRSRRGTGSRPMDNCDYDLWSISGPPSIILHSDMRDHKVVVRVISTLQCFALIPPIFGEPCFFGASFEDTRLPSWMMKRWNIEIRGDTEIREGN